MVDQEFGEQVDAHKQTITLEVSNHLVPNERARRDSVHQEHTGITVARLHTGNPPAVDAAPLRHTGSMIENDPPPPRSQGTPGF